MAFVKLSFIEISSKPWSHFQSDLGHVKLLLVKLPLLTLWKENQATLRILKFWQSSWSTKLTNNIQSKAISSWKFQEYKIQQQLDNHWRLSMQMLFRRTPELNFNGGFILEMESSPIYKIWLLKFKSPKWNPELIAILLDNETLKHI